MAKKTISVIERRLQGPNVFRTSSQPIPLSEGDRYVVRWENSKISPDHIWNVIHNLGWVYAEPADLACKVDEIGAQERDGRIVRGERGDEVLMKMLSADYAKVSKLKDQQTRDQTFGQKQLKSRIVSEVASAHGDQAAEWMNKSVKSVSVSDARGPEDVA